VPLRSRSIFTTFALALLWARWKTTFIHFCMFSHQTYLSISISLSLSLSFSLSLSLSLLFSLFLCPSVSLSLFYISFVAMRRGCRSHNVLESFLLCKSKESNKHDKKLLNPSVTDKIWNSWTLHLIQELELIRIPERTSSASSATSKKCRLVDVYH